MARLFILIFFVLFLLPVTEAQSNAGFKRYLSSLNPDKSLKIRHDGLRHHPLPGISSVMLSTVGPAFCFGDVGGSPKEQILLGSNDFVLSKTRYLVALGIQQALPSNLVIKATTLFGSFAGTDAGSRHACRGYSFQTNVLEFSVQGEYIFYGGPYSKSLTPHAFYVFAGAGIMTSHAKFSTTPGIGLRDEDMEKSTATAPVFPFGLGYQYRVSDKLTAGVEFGWHSILSDYVDGVTTKHSKNNDVLAMLTFTIAYKIYGNVPNDNRCNCE